MIYVTGDCHGDIEKLDPKAFPMQNEMTKDDYVIICGDFGLIWNYENESEYEKRYLNWLNSRSFTTLFVDGNHENFTRLYDYPVEKWNGGLVHKIRDSVLHLMRGEVFSINDKKIFAFGGASSHDVQDGILDMDEEEKIYRLRKQGACFRIRDFSWWDLELPTDKEMQNGVNNLKNVNYKVDYVITHCCPSDIQALISRYYKTDKLTDYLLEINKKLDFQKWFFGHYHINENINEKFTCLYEDITPIENCEKTQKKGNDMKTVKWETKKCYHQQVIDICDDKLMVLRAHEISECEECSDLFPSRLSTTIKGKVYCPLCYYEYLDNHKKNYFKKG